MKTIFKPILFAILGIQLISCSKKNDDVIETDYVIAGKIYKQGVILEFNYLLLTRKNDRTVTTEGKYIFDLNNNFISDLEFNSEINQGFRCTVCGLNSCEILTDTLDYIYRINNYPEIRKRTITPKILSAGDTISNKGQWLSERNRPVPLHFQVSTLISAGPTIRYEYFQGWDRCTDKYLGYRIITASDTAYGWLGLETADTRIFLGKSFNK